MSWLTYVNKAPPMCGDLHMSMFMRTFPYTLWWVKPMSGGEILKMWSQLIWSDWPQPPRPRLHYFEDAPSHPGGCALHFSMVPLMSEGGTGRRGRKILEKLGMSLVHSLGHLLPYASNTHDVGVSLGLIP
jgi:hypothetical protein